jgi:hypothetical protein
VNIMSKLQSVPVVNRVGLGLLAAAVAASIALATSGLSDPRPAFAGDPSQWGAAANGKHIGEAVLTGDPSQWGVAGGLGTQKVNEYEGQHR